MRRADIRAGLWYARETAAGMVLFRKVIAVTNSWRAESQHAKDYVLYRDRFCPAWHVPGLFLSSFANNWAQREATAEEAAKEELALTPGPPHTEDLR